MSLHCFREKEASITALAEKIVAVCAAALEHRPGFSLVLAGGSTPADLYTLLASPPWRDRIEWSKGHIFFGDERCVSPDHRDSNYGMARHTLLSALPIPSVQIYRIRGEADPAVEAAAYQRRIESTLATISSEKLLFDLVLLGLGEDGHTASLFPGDAALHSSDLVAPVAAVPNRAPAVDRISLTVRGVMQARHICFLVHGQAKGKIVEAVLADKNGSYPAALIQKNSVSWYLSGMECEDIFGDKSLSR